MKKMLQKGFTLIELLVVITIIGILATGAVTVYTSQMTKARDSTRLSDVKALQGAIEQTYLTQYRYPNRGLALGTEVVAFMGRLPRDPRFWLTTNISGAATALDYLYQAVDETGTTSANAQRYELSLAFEWATGVPNVATDSGNDALRHEIGVKNTGATPITTARTTLIDPAATSGQCVAATGNANGTCADTRWTIIR